MLGDNTGDDLIGNNDKEIILVRSILYSFSYSCCFVSIIVYFVLCLQVKCNACTTKKDDSNSFLEDNTDSERGSKKNKTEQGKIGLGSNFMFLITISNFFGSIFEFLFYFYYKDKELDINERIKDENLRKIRLYKEINEENLCHWFGFAHNFFDLFAACWTSMLTLLFYKSTNLSSEILYKDNKYLMIGFIFSSAVCAICCGIPMLTNSYGFGRFYCSFRYSDITDDNHVLGETLLNKFWRIFFVIVASINTLFNIYCLFKTHLFYSKKLEKIKTQNRKEYKKMFLFIWVFRIFPIILILSRFFKGLARIMIDYTEKGGIIEKIFAYLNGLLFASNGIFDSIACLLFFKGVFRCCTATTAPRTLSEDEGSGPTVNYLGKMEE